MSNHRFNHLGRLMIVVLVVALVGLPSLSAFRAADEVTLTYGWWSNGPDGDKNHQAWIADFQAAHPTIKIEAEILPWGAYWDKVQTTMAGGSSYDLIGFTSSFLAPYMANELLLDLSTLPGYQETAALVDPSILSIFNWEGKQYGMPVGIAARTFGYRKDYFEEAGIALPDPTKPFTIDQIIEIGKKLTVTDSSGKITRYAWNPNAGEPWWGLVSARGGSFFDNYVNPTKVTINTPEGIAGLKDFQRLIDEKIVPPYAEWEDNQWGGGGVDSLQTNTIAMGDIGPWSFASIRENKLAIGNMPYPVGAEGATSILHSGANGYTINKESEHVNEAWTFIQWMLTKEAQLKYAQWSDIPASTEARTEVFKTLEPQELVPAVQAQLQGFRPNLLTANTELETLLKQILRDMTEGKLTPEEAAAAMEEQGNAKLAE